ncbi:MAG: adenylosuccinate lyase [Dehalococcoidia bacterium]|jgi:adenylosuccinate lyase|nr:adenylosuccinate lyase [Dehalococcoidia bacterium]
MIERYSLPEMKHIWSEEHKFALWLKVEIAVCEAWCELGRIPPADMEKIRGATCNLDRLAEILRVTHHDVTAFLGAVSESLGPESRYIHLGLTSSDVMDTALGLQLRDAAAVLRKDVDALTAALRKRALEHKNTIMIGRTHGVHAEPMTFGLKLALWVKEMERNAVRLSRATDAISVGMISGAVGTHATVPLEVEDSACRRLGLGVAEVTNQVIQRDRHAEFLTTLAIIAGSLEKFATEVRALQKTEVQELEEPFEEGQTGSSAMPHKRNPELCERVSGLSRLMRANAMASLENIALWHERDISHSSVERIILPDSCLVLDYTLTIFTSIIQGMKVNADRMRQNVDMTRGLIFSQRALLALIDKGMSRQVAYEVVQKHAMEAWHAGQPFRGLLEADSEVGSRLTREELDRVFDHNCYLREVDRIFARAGIEGGSKSAGATRRC